MNLTTLEKLIDFLSSEEKDSLYFKLEDFKNENPQIHVSARLALDEILGFIANNS